MTTQLQTTTSAPLIPAGHPKHVQDFCVALQGTKALSQPSEALDKQIHDCLTMLHAGFAQQPEIQDMVFLVTALRDAIDADFPQLKTTELQHALRLAATGAYGRPYGKISLAFCCDALRAYLDDSRRAVAIEELRALRERHQRQNEVQRIYSAEEKREIYLQGLLAEYQRQYPLNSGGVIYDLLDAMGMITAGAERKKELMAKLAASKVEELLDVERTLPREQRHDIRRQISALTTPGGPQAVAMAKTQLCAEVLAELRDMWADDLQGLSEFLGEKLSEALDANGDIIPRKPTQSQNA